MQTESMSRNSVGLTIVLVGSALLLFGIAEVRAQTVPKVYYEVWRSPSEDLTTAEPVEEWLEGPEETIGWLDPGPFEEGQEYFYWVRAITARQATTTETFHLVGEPTDPYPPDGLVHTLTLTYPVKAPTSAPERVIGSPFRHEARMTADIGFDPFVYTVSHAIYEADFDIYWPAAAMTSWADESWDPYVDGSPNGYESDKTEHIDVRSFENFNSIAEVYAETTWDHNSIPFSRYKMSTYYHGLIEIALVSELDAPPSNLDATVAPDGIYVTWPESVLAEVTSFTPAVSVVWISDCNGNTIPDECDIDCGASGGPCDVAGCGESQDCDEDGMPDECEPDADADGVIDDCDDCPDTIPGAEVDEFGCPALIPGDGDRDGDVDMRDYLMFTVCRNEVPTPECLDSFDLNGDGEIDLDDYAELEPNLDGPDVLPAPPGMQPIPGGEFQMGDSFAEGGSDEVPVHTVLLSTYSIDQYEVTNAQYAAALNWAREQGGLISVTGNVVYQLGSGTSFPYCDTTNSSSHSRITWDGSMFGVVAGREDHPMLMVSWYGSVAYCNWRSAMEGKPLCYDRIDEDPPNWTCNFGVAGYRLPTEAEWEKAAGWDPAQQRHFRFGEHTDGCGTNCLDGHRANYRESGDPFDNGTTRVGYYDGTNHGGYQTQDAKNYYGCYDMSGNVWEWCNDWYDSGYYGSSPYDNPQGPTSGTYRVLRGGDWNNYEVDSRSARRVRATPGLRDSNKGFRVAEVSEQIPDSELSTDFEDLPPSWYFVVPPEPPGQSYEVANGWLTMTTTGPTDLYPGYDSAPKLLELFPLGACDFTIETRVQAAPDEDFEHAGILLYEDANNWIRLIRDSNNSGGVNLQSPSHEWHSSPSDATDVVLQINRASSRYTGMFSTDGGYTFVEVGVYDDYDWVPPEIGLTIVSTPADNLFQADFDYFYVYTECP